MTQLQEGLYAVITTCFAAAVSVGGMVFFYHLMCKVWHILRTLSNFSFRIPLKHTNKETNQQSFDIFPQPNCLNLLFTFLTPFCLWQHRSLHPNRAQRTMKAAYILRTQTSAAVKVNCSILRCSELPRASLETSALAWERNREGRRVCPETECDSSRATGATSFRNTMK